MGSNHTNPLYNMNGLSWVISEQIWADSWVWLQIATSSLTCGVTILTRLVLCEKKNILISKIRVNEL